MLFYLLDKGKFYSRETSISFLSILDKKARRLLMARVSPLILWSRQLRASAGLHHWNAENADYCRFRQMIGEKDFHVLCSYHLDSKIEKDWDQYRRVQRTEDIRLLAHIIAGTAASFLLKPFLSQPYPEIIGLGIIVIGLNHRVSIEKKLQKNFSQTLAGNLFKSYGAIYKTLENRDEILDKLEPLQRKTLEIQESIKQLSFLKNQDLLSINQRVEIEHKILANLNKLKNIDPKMNALKLVLGEENSRLNLFLKKLNDFYKNLQHVDLQIKEQEAQLRKAHYSQTLQKIEQLKNDLIKTKFFMESLRIC